LVECNRIIVNGYQNIERTTSTTTATAGNNRNKSGNEPGCEYLKKVILEVCNSNPIDVLSVVTMDTMDTFV
jgi:hypothetical protein